MKKYRIGDIAFFNSRNIDKSFKYKAINYLDTSSITENVIDSFQYLDSTKDKNLFFGKTKIKTLRYFIKTRS